jgi:hypothetical protein
MRRRFGRDVHLAFFAKRKASVLPMVFLLNMANAPSLLSICFNVTLRSASSFERVPGGFGHQPLGTRTGARGAFAGLGQAGAGKARQTNRPGPRKHGLRLSPLR